MEGVAEAQAISARAGRRRRQRGGGMAPCEGSNANTVFQDKIMEKFYIIKQIIANEETAQLRHGILADPLGGHHFLKMLGLQIAYIHNSMAPKKNRQ